MGRSNLRLVGSETSRQTQSSVGKSELAQDLTPTLDRGFAPEQIIQIKQGVNEKSRL
ncbi:MAG: hypothetical protein WCT16_02080 [Candidatus Buchananbacteria bacterium]